MIILVTRRIRVLSIFKPATIRADWEETVCECQECGCRFRLMPDDEPKIFARLEEVDAGHVGVNDCLIYFVFCPEGCGKMVYISNPFFPNKDDYQQASFRRTSA